MIHDLPQTLAENTPYYKYLGIQVMEANNGFAKLRLEFKDCLTHPFGYFHGGAIASLADSAGINSVLTTLNDEEKALTLEMKINYLLPVKDSAICAEARVIHRGKKSAVADVDVKSDDGHLVAKAVVTCVII
jgi:acyl-CoA thioesterase